MQPPDVPTRLLRIAVVGTGYRADAHISTIVKMQDMYRLAAVCDILPERVKEAAARYSVPGYSDLETMLQDERPDVVLVAVPPEVHHRVAVTAARYKAHVLCETPISITMAYSDQMIAAAKENGVALEVAENVWRRPEERFKKVLIQSGMLGEIRTARLWYTSGSYHGINALRTLVGSEVKRVVGMVKVMEAAKARRGLNRYHIKVFSPTTPEPVRFSETTVATWEAGLLEFENGVVATYEFPIASRPRGNFWEVHGTKGHISGQDVVLYNPARWCRIVVENEGEEGRKVPVRVRLYEGDQPLSDVVWENPYVRYQPGDLDEVARMDQLTGVYRAATEGIEPEYGAENAKKDIEVLIGVAESALKGSMPVDLPLTRATEYEKRLSALY